MIGRVYWQNFGRFRVQGKQGYCHQLPLYEVGLWGQGRLLPLRLKQAGRLFQRQGIGQILTPTDFPHWDVLKKEGISPYEPLPQLQALGDVILQRRLETCGIAPENATIALWGDSPALKKVALSLCPWVKNLMILAPRQKDSLERLLYEEYGMAPCASTTQVDGVISFVPPPDEKTGLIIQLDQVSSPDFCGIQLKNQDFPPDCHPLSLLALLLETGKAKREELEIT